MRDRTHRRRGLATQRGLFARPLHSGLLLELVMSSSKRGTAMEGLAWGAHQGAHTIRPVFDFDCHSSKLAGRPVAYRSTVARAARAGCAGGGLHAARAAGCRRCSGWLRWAARSTFWGLLPGRCRRPRCRPLSAQCKRVAEACKALAHWDRRCHQHRNIFTS